MRNRFLGIVLGLAWALAACTIAPAPGGGTTPPLDTNAYPFTPPASYAGGVWEVGTGPDRLEISAANPADQQTSFAIVNGTQVLAAPVTIKSVVGGSGLGDTYVIHGTGLCANPQIHLNGVAPYGIHLWFFNGANCNYQPLVANGVYDSRGRVSVNDSTLMISNGAPLTLTYPVAVTPPPPPTPQTLINGKTLNDLTNGTNLGNILNLPAQTIAGIASVPTPLTVSGAGQGKTILDGTGLGAMYSKGGMVPLVSGATFQHMTMRNYSITAALGSNGAAIRQQGDQIDFTVDDVEIDHNQMGILAFPAHVVIKNSYFHDNGAGDGFSHNLYAGSGGVPGSVGELDISDSRFEHANVGHEIKSRWGKTWVVNTTVVTGGNGSCYDQPDIGYLLIQGGSCEVPAGSPDIQALGFGMESTKNAAVTNGHIVDISNWTLIQGTGVQAILQSLDPDSVINCSNSFYTGDLPPKIQGFKTVNCVLQKKAA